jgi:hypothetical protein
MSPVRVIVYAVFACAFAPPTSIEARTELRSASLPTKKSTVGLDITSPIFGLYVAIMDERQGAGKQRSDQAQPRTPCAVCVEDGPDRVDGMMVTIEEAAQDGLPLGVIEEHRCLQALAHLAQRGRDQRADNGAAYAGMKRGVLQEKRGEKERPRPRKAGDEMHSVLHVLN